jgi:hypothetical protein
MSLDEEALRRAFAELRARVAFIERSLGLFVDDAALDKPRANIKVGFDPRNWKGPSFKGKRASECSPEFLEAYAEALSWMAAHPKEGADPKKSEYNRLDSARARSWSRRLRSQTASSPRGGARQETDAEPREHLTGAAEAQPAGLFEDDDDFPSEDSAPDAAMEDEDPFEEDRETW